MKYMNKNNTYIYIQYGCKSKKKKVNWMNIQTINQFL